MFRDAILSISRSKQEDMALGAALTIAGALTSNRFSINGKPAHTAMYTLNVAGTGAGKGAAIDFIHDLFSPMGLGSNKYFKLLGLHNYSSDVAIIAKLEEQRTRLDIIDEFGQVFKGLATKGDRKSAVGECLKILFSARGYFSGHHTQTNGTQGACMSPAISLLGSIQPETLLNNASPEVLFDGFMGRFMYFMENINAEWTGNQCNGGINRDVLDFISKACFETYPENPLIEFDLIGNKIESIGMREYSRARIDVPKQVLDAITELDMLHYKHIQESKKNGDNVRAALSSRSIELTDKLMKIVCVSGGCRTITLDHLEMAKNLVEIASLKSIDFLMQSSESLEARIGKRILSFVKLNKEGQVKRNEAMRYCRLNSKEMKDGVSYLVARGEIVESSIGGSSFNNKNRPAVYLTDPSFIDAKLDNC